MRRSAELAQLHHGVTGHGHHEREHGRVADDEATERWYGHQNSPSLQGSGKGPVTLPVVTPHATRFSSEPAGKRTMNVVPSCGLLSRGRAPAIAARDGVATRR